MSNLTAAKLVAWLKIGSLTLLTPAAVLAYAVTFLFTDIISEVYGKRLAQKTVWIGFGSQILMLTLVQLGSQILQGLG